MSTIKSIAHPNELTKEVKNDYYLSPLVMGTLYTEDILKRLEDREVAITSVNGPAFVQIFHRECIRAVSEGYNVVTDLFRITLGIRGVIYKKNLGHSIPAEQIDVRMNFTQGVEARNAIKSITVEVAEQPAPSGPVIHAVTNPTVNKADTLNIGNMALIQGLRIAVSGDKIDEIGVFFTSLADRTTVHVPMSQISPNTPTKLQFVLPATVTAGEWNVAIATQSSGNSAIHVENVRRSEYSEIITVIE